MKVVREGGLFVNTCEVTSEAAGSGCLGGGRYMDDFTTPLLSALGLLDAGLSVQTSPFLSK
jgi:hypothetical protein